MNDAFQSLDNRSILFDVYERHVMCNIYSHFIVILIKCLLLNE